MTDGVFDITTGNILNPALQSTNTDTIEMQISEINALIAAIES
jgi:hypothetical protein